jgi:RsiW-degrading membrane proteinase PrsW (M82 family)
MMSNTLKFWIVFAILAAAMGVLALVILPWLGVPQPWSWVVGGALFGVGVGFAARRFPLTNRIAARQ